MNHESIRARLLGAGAPDAAAARWAALFSRATTALARWVAAPPTHAWIVPGRLEVLGKHTDYAGGRSLVCAIERGFCIVSRPRGDATVTVIDARTGERATGPCTADASFGDAAWARYPQAVVRRIARNFPGVRPGADVAFASNLPPAAGLSSSSAMVVAVFLALAEAGGIERHSAYRATITAPEDLAAYLATVENGMSFGSLDGDAGVGTLGGSEDHTAILCGRQGVLGQYAFCPTRLERTVMLPPGVVFAIASSGIVAAKARGARDAYNRASREAREIVARWNEATRGGHVSLAGACGPSGEHVEAIGRFLAPTSKGAASSIDGATAARLADRLEQFTRETFELVPEAAAALARADFEAFGRVVHRSQALAETKLRNQVPETVDLVRLAGQLGARAASAFGAGFGGSVWALAGVDDAGALLSRWRDAYERAHPEAGRRAAFFLTTAGPGALALHTGARTTRRPAPLI